jgi:O-acetyl-ADP-ribose deacetylase (regulator of RNase III)
VIVFKKGNILDEETEALVNTVNCVGIMGRGIALQFKNTYPENYKAYLVACNRNEVQPGRLFVYDTGHLTNPRYIINFPTKRHWKGKSRIEDVDSGLEALAEVIQKRQIKSIAIPPLGSGLGGLDWAIVRPRIEATLKKFPHLEAIIYEPSEAPADSRPNYSSDIPGMTSGRAALVGLMQQYLAGLLDPCITLLEVHKLMYFMQQSGEPLRLNYTKGAYGPYATNLRHVLNAIEGHLISGYADGGDVPTKELQLIPGALSDATSFLAQKPLTQKRLRKVADLVEGFESSFGLELLSTVHWVANKEPVNTLDELITHVYAWNDRKHIFTKRQIAVAAKALANQGWVKNIGNIDAGLTQTVSPC